jgi:protein-S-isoprenylcysteine O-methyltransferase
MTFPLPILLGLAYGISEAGLGILRRSRDDSVDADDSTLHILWITVLVSLIAAFTIAARLPSAAMEHRDAALWIGSLLFAAGLGLRWYAIVYLGRFFTVNVAIHSLHEVVDTGPYRRIRHPSYAGALVAFLGLALCLGNWASLAMVMLPVTWAFARRISIEEHALANALGSPYTRYMQRTKRLAPYIY